MVKNLKHKRKENKNLKSIASSHWSQSAPKKLPRRKILCFVFLAFSLNYISKQLIIFSPFLLINL